MKELKLCETPQLRLSQYWIASTTDSNVNWYETTARMTFQMALWKLGDLQAYFVFKEPLNQFWLQVNYPNYDWTMVRRHPPYYLRCQDISSKQWVLKGEWVDYTTLPNLTIIPDHGYTRRQQHKRARKLPLYYDGNNRSPSRKFTKAWVADLISNGVNISFDHE